MQRAFLFCVLVCLAAVGQATEVAIGASMATSLAVREGEPVNSVPAKGSVKFEDCCGKACQGFKGLEHEYCFGAVGAQCEGVIVWAPKTEEKGKKGKAKLKVSVGSIFHDLCCHQHPKGQMCGNKNQIQLTATDTCSCTMEWRRAVSDSATQRQWEAEFDTENPSDLTPIADPSKSRPTWLPNHELKPLGPSQWDILEFVGTAKLYAPAGTELDCPEVDPRCSLTAKDVVAGDSIFCKSLKFSKIVQPAGKLIDFASKIPVIGKPFEHVVKKLSPGRYGVCADGDAAPYSGQKALRMRKAARQALKPY